VQVCARNMATATGSKRVTVGPMAQQAADGGEDGEEMVDVNEEDDAVRGPRHITMAETEAVTRCETETETETLGGALPNNE